MIGYLVDSGPKRECTIAHTSKHNTKRWKIRPQTKKTGTTQNIMAAQKRIKVTKHESSG